MAVDCWIDKAVNICTCLAVDYVDWYGCEYLYMYSFGSCGLVRLWDCFGLVWLQIVCIGKAADCLGLVWLLTVCLGMAIDRLDRHAVDRWD
jgi:hypothetical protein